MPRASEQVLARLAQLESELRVMRRALAEAAEAEPSLPSTDLHVLRCRIGADVYGVQIESVMEIVRYVRVTRVPDVPSSVVGAINVRGDMVPVIDTRRRLGHVPGSPRRGTAILLIRVEGRSAGLIVDEVLDVVVVPQHTLRAPSGALASAHAIAAIAAVEPRVVQIIALAELLSASDWTKLDDAIESVRPAAPSGDGGPDGIG